jgi:hypothetical protein
MRDWGRRGANNHLTKLGTEFKSMGRALHSAELLATLFLSLWRGGTAT